MRSRTTWIILALLLTGSLFVRINMINKHRFPTGDEGPWLRMASRFGTPAFLESRVIEHDLYVSKTIPHPEDNRSPLYPALINLVAHLFPDYCRAGQIVNIVTFIVLFFLVFFIMHNRFGTVAALLSVLFLGVSPLFIVFTSQIYPDMLLALGFWYLLATANNLTRTVRGALFAGILWGALLLLKTTAVFLAPLFLYHFVRRRGDNQRWFLPLITFGTAFSLFLPWAIRNTVTFGSPTFQLSTYNLYVDNFFNLLTIGAPRPSLSAMIAEHGLFFSLIIRPFAGLKNMALLFPQFDHHLSLALLPMALLGIVILFKKKAIPRGLFVFALPYGAFMSFIAHAVWVSRFTMIFYLLLYGTAAFGGASVITYFWKKRQFTASALLTLLALLPCAAIAYPLEYYQSSRGSDRNLDTAICTLIGKMQQSIPADAVILSPYLSSYCHLHNYGIINNLRYHRVDDLTNLLQYYHTAYVLLSPAEDAKLLNDLSHATHAFTLATTDSVGPFVLYIITYCNQDKSEKYQSPES